jgi:hypothetical protein
VFVSADTHLFSVNNLTYQDHFGGPQIATSAIEVDTMAVASQLIATHIPPLLAQAGILCRRTNWRNFQRRTWRHLDHRPTSARYSSGHGSTSIGGCFTLDNAS